MNVTIKRRNPDEESLIIQIEDIEYSISLDTYLEIIKPILRITSSSSYLELRNQTLFEYFNSEPKEQFSW